MNPAPAIAVGRPSSTRAISDRSVDPETGLVASREVISGDVVLADRPLLVAVIVVFWMGTGLLGATLMSRRGHDFRPLAGLGIVLGPLFGGFVVANLWPRERGAQTIVVRRSSPLGGETRVAILLLDDTARLADAQPTLAEVGSIERVDVIRPITYETADGTGTEGDRDRAMADLDAAAHLLSDLEPGLILVPGTTARVLSDYIGRTRPNLVLVVGGSALDVKVDHQTGDDVTVIRVPTDQR